MRVYIKVFVSLQAGYYIITRLLQVLQWLAVIFDARCVRTNFSRSATRCWSTTKTRTAAPEDPSVATSVVKSLRTKTVCSTTTMHTTATRARAQRSDYVECEWKWRKFKIIVLQLWTEIFSILETVLFKINFFFISINICVYICSLVNLQPCNLCLNIHAATSACYKTFHVSNIRAIIRLVH